MAGNKVIAIDIGGTLLRVGLVKNNKIIKYIKKRTPKEKKLFIKELTSSISVLIDKDVKGIGIACAGPLKDGIIKNPPNLPLKNFNLKKFLEKKFKKRVEIENDAGCIALAEVNFGCKKKNFIILTLGTGIGGGIIINKKLYKGQEYAGEIGHIIIDNGKYFEELAASKKIRTLTKKYFSKSLLINDLLKINNPKSTKILQEVSMYLGQGIASIINIFDPEIVILSGGIKETGSRFLNMIKKQTKKYTILPKTTIISWTKLNHPGILGASLLLK